MKLGNAHMAGLAILQKKITKALDGAKRQYLRTHDADSPREIGRASCRERVFE